MASRKRALTLPQLQLPTSSQRQPEKKQHLCTEAEAEAASHCDAHCDVDVAASAAPTPALTMAKATATLPLPLPLPLPFAFAGECPKILAVTSFMDGRQGSQPWPVTLRLDASVVAAACDLTYDQALQLLVKRLRIDVCTRDGERGRAYTTEAGRVQDIAPLAWCVSFSEVQRATGGVGLPELLTIYVQRKTLPLSVNMYGAPLRLVATLQNDDGSQYVCWSPCFTVMSRLTRKHAAGGITFAMASCDAAFRPTPAHVDFRAPQDVKNAMAACPERSRGLVCIPASYVDVVARSAAAVDTTSSAAASAAASAASAETSTPASCTSAEFALSSFASFADVFCGDVCPHAHALKSLPLDVDSLYWGDTEGFGRSTSPCSVGFEYEERGFA